MGAKNRLVKDLEPGTRVEVVWEDAFHADNSEEDPKTKLLCYDLGYFGRSDRHGVKIWREIDEEGEFRWEMNIPRGVIKKIMRLGPRPRGTTKPLGSV